MGRLGNTFCPRRAAKNGNCNFLLSTEGREGARRTATATPFVHEGARRTATATSFCPRRATKDHEERQLQLLFVHEGPRRAAKNGNGNFLLSTKGRDHEERAFCPRRAAKGHEGPRRTATATPFCPRRAAKGHEGPRRTATATPFCPRRAAKGHEGPRRTATATPFVHGGPLGAAENFLLIHGVRGVSGEESGVRGRSGRLSQGAQGLWRGRCAFWWLDDL